MTNEIYGCTCKDCMCKTEMLDEQMWARRKAMLQSSNTDDDDV